MAQSNLTQLAVPTIISTSSLVTKSVYPEQASRKIYDFQVNWIQGLWAGTTSSGWFCYDASTLYPCLELFELTLEGLLSSVVPESSGCLPLYWDGVGVNLNVLSGDRSHVLLYTDTQVTEAGRQSYYLSFAETALGRLVNLYSGCCYTYMGSGLMSYKQRVVHFTI